MIGVWYMEGAAVIFDNWDMQVFNMRMHEQARGGQPPVESKMRAVGQSY